MWTYRARLVRVVDGDTFDVDVDLGFHVWVRERLRLAGVDTPEMRGPERPAGLAAQMFVREWWPAPPAWVTVRTAKTGKFGRWIASVTRPDGRDLGDDLVAAGHAVRLD